MPPRKKTSTATKKAAPVAAQKAVAVKATAAAKRGSRAAPQPVAPAAPVPATPPVLATAPVPAAPKKTKYEIELEVTLTPVEGNKIRLDFSTGKRDESANLSPKRTLRDAFLVTCRLQGIEDAEVVKCTDVNRKMVSDHTLARVLGHCDDTYCNVTFR